jgi:cell division septum initiation protein DivIVA
VVNSSGDTVEWEGFDDEELSDMIGNANEFIENFENHIEELEQEVETLKEKTKQECGKAYMPFQES